VIAVYRDKEELNHAVANHIVKLVRQGAAERRLVRIALSGGETPKGSYAQLARLADGDLPWQWSEWYWGDERMVPTATEGSNQRLARQAFLEPAKVSEEQIFPIPFGPAEESAWRYEALLREKFCGRMPEFDLILLGVGTDGHTASLFPGHPALTEERRWVAPVTGRADGIDRVTFTLPLINRGKNVLFVAAGADKAAVVHAVLGQPQAAMAAGLPAAMVTLGQGVLQWYLDEAAGAKLRPVKIVK